MTVGVCEAAQAREAPQVPTLELGQTAQFFEMLAAMTSAGIPLARALDGLAQQPGYDRALGLASHALQSGHSLSRSFAVGGFRDPMLLGLLQLGERTGTLDRVLGELAVLFRWRSQMRSELRARLVYPVMLAVSCALLVGLGPPLLLKPILDFLTQTGSALPASTLVLMALVQGLSSPWCWLLMAGLVGLMYSSLRRLGRGSPRAVERWLLNRRAIGPSLSLLYSLRFVRALLSCLSSGFPLLAGVELAARCSGSVVVQAEGQATCARLIAGDSPEEAFGQLGSLDPLLVSSISLGLSVGAVEDVLGAVLKLSQERFQRTTEEMLALLEPVLLAFMGLLVALCIVATVSPMMSLLRGVT